jgi:hypothetical protein
MDASLRRSLRDISSNWIRKDSILKDYLPFMDNYTVVQHACVWVVAYRVEQMKREVGRNNAALR